MKNKRILGILLAAIMLVTFLPAMASAASPVVMLKAATSGTKAVKLSWNKPSGATKFVVYGNKTGKSYKKLKTTSSTSYKVKKIGKTKLAAHKYYKFYVVAYKGSTKLATSKSIVFITGKTAGKYANAKGISVSPKSATLDVGQTKTLKPKTTLYKKKKHIKKSYGAATRYLSNDTTVATVSSAGKVTAKKAGTATIYVQDIGGKYCTSKITVKQPYYVSFNMNGHGAQINKVKYYAGNMVKKPTDPTATDCVFKGWYKDNSFTTAWDFDTDTLTANTTLYAMWNYNINYLVKDTTMVAEEGAWKDDGNARTCYIDNGLKFEGASTVTLPLDTELERGEGLTWTYTNDGTTYVFDTYYDGTLASIEVTGNTNINGKYVPDSDENKTYWTLAWLDQETTPSYAVDMKAAKAVVTTLPAVTATLDKEGDTTPTLKYEITDIDTAEKVSDYFTIDANSPKITTAADAKCGRYTLTLKATAAANGNHHATVMDNIKVEIAVANATSKKIAEIVNTIEAVDASKVPTEENGEWFDKDNEDVSAFWRYVDNDGKTVKNGTFSIRSIKNESRTRTDETDTYYEDADHNYVFVGAGGTWKCIMEKNALTSLVYTHNKSANKIYDGTYTTLPMTVVTLDVNGGTSTQSTASVVKRRTSTSIIKPTRTNCTFLGWYDAQYDGNKVIGTNGAFEKSVAGFTDASGKWINEADTATLYAHWTAPVSISLGNTFPMNADDAWLTEDGAKCYLDDDKLVFTKSEKTSTLQIDTVATEIENGWKVEAGEDKSYTFNLDATTGKLTSIVVTGVTVDEVSMDGTYLPAATYTTEPKAITTLVYSGEAQTLVTAGETSHGTVQYALGTDATTAPVDKWSTEVPTGKNAVTYYVWHYIDADDSHIDNKPACIPVEIAKADAAVTTTPTGKDNLVEKETAQELINAGTATGGDLYYALGTSTECPETSAEDAWNTTVPVGTTVGTYYIYYYVKGDDNHNSTTPNATPIEVTITEHTHDFGYEASGNVITATCKNEGCKLTEKKVTLTLTATSRAYNGQAFAATTDNETTKFSTITGKTVTIEYYSTGEGAKKLDVAPTNAGTYTAKITVEQAVAVQEFTISKIDATATAPSEKTGLTYTGAEQDLMTAGTSEDGKWKYAVSEEAPADDVYSEDIPKGKNAGNYKVWYKFEGDTNHKDINVASTTVLIAKADITGLIPPTAGTNLKYTGEAMNIATAGSCDLGKMYYAVSTSTNKPASGDWKETIDQKTDAGTYYVHYYVAATDSTNFNDTSKASYISVVIAPVTISEILPDGFPTAYDDGWVNSEYHCYLSDTILKFAGKNGENGNEFANELPTDTSVTKVANGWMCTIGDATYTFVIEGNLDCINVSNLAKVSDCDLNGDYLPQPE